jgi:hypothetical protein
MLKTMALLIRLDYLKAMPSLATLINKKAFLQTAKGLSHT